MYDLGSSSRNYQVGANYIDVLKIMQCQYVSVMVAGATVTHGDIQTDINCALTFGSL